MDDDSARPQVFNRTARSSDSSRCSKPLPLSVLMAPITINIKASNDKKYSVQFDTDKTVAELKEEISKVSEIEASRQRLIYSGRVLSKDDDKLDQYKVKDGNTIHLVQGKSPAAAGANAQGTSSPAAAQPQIPMSAGTGVGNPLTGLTGARYAGQIGLPNASLFGADGGMTGNFGGEEDMAEMLSQPGVREAMEAAFSNPQFIDQMINSNPQLRDAPPYVRQMLQSPEFRRQMMDPNFIRQMNQMQRLMGGGPAQPAAFPAPGPATNADTAAAGTASGTGTNPTNATGPQTTLPDIGQMMQMMQGAGGNAAGPGAANAGGAGGADMFSQMMQNPALMSMLGGMGGLGASPASNAPADTRPPEERYAEQLRQLNDMGFFDFEQNVSALRRSGGSVQGAIEALLSGSI
ncbi:hypothetical protein BCR37DRAFT_376614, partial [Protomyces lactucae-debilis]